MMTPPKNGIKDILDRTDLSPEQREAILLEHLWNKLTAIEAKVDRLLERENEWDARLRTLAQNSVLLLMKQHPKAAGIVILVLMILLNLWFVSDFRINLLEHLGDFLIP